MRGDIIGIRKRGRASKLGFVQDRITENAGKIFGALIGKQVAPNGALE
jgi:hypothetical protein